MPLSTTTSSSILAAMLASAASAHVVLENPPPAKFPAYGPTNPIETSGSDWPCKIPAGQKLDTSDASPKTDMVIGEPQKLSFKGKAVHGGGSCQLALTKGWDPKKDSPWSVIHSIEGGCRARNQKGNLEGDNSDIYEFKIPAGIAPGGYTFAWTWLARIGGGPEMYMNCGLVVVKGPKTKRMQMSARRDLGTMSKRADFPELYIDNIAAMDGGCTTNVARNQQISIAYPNPGPSVERPEGDKLFKQTCDGNPRAKKGSGGAAKPTTHAAPVPTTSVAVPAPEPSPAAPIPGPIAPGAGGTQNPSTPCTHGQFACFADGTEGYVCTGTKWVKIFDVPHSDPPRKCKPGVGNGENLVLVDA
ncbi:hypothetical protein PG994_003311 [Apiospora phragmitis]|uniref:Lytic polysaccharide monooxygenase n=1 Tax=Apiospora phragmitis TaxID=2905665 RepID=A0ABR1W1J2_9PEZI